MNDIIESTNIADQPKRPQLTKRIIEAALFAADEPLTIEHLLALFTEDQKPDRKIIKDMLQQLIDDYAERGIELKELASGFQFQVQSLLSPWIQRLWEEKPTRYSRALLETLALIAYQQPITRGEIEEIRGVVVSTPMIRTLMDREWIRIVGYRDVPGKPALYATTKQFLDYFGLKNLSELPPLSEVQDLEQVGKKLEAELQNESEEQNESTPTDENVADDVVDAAAIGMVEVDVVETAIDAVGLNEEPAHEEPEDVVDACEEPAHEEPEDIVDACEEPAHEKPEDIVDACEEPEHEASIEESVERVEAENEAVEDLLAEEEVEADTQAVSEEKTDEKNLSEALTKGLEKYFEADEEESDLDKELEDYINEAFGDEDEDYLEEEEDDDIKPLDVEEDFFDNIEDFLNVDDDFDEDNPDIFYNEKNRSEDDC